MQKTNKYTLIYFLVLVGVIILAARFPLTNDESYYIEFAKYPQLSYIDAPPFVAYLNLIQIHIFHLHSALAMRILVLITHLIATLILLDVVRNNLDKNNPSYHKTLLAAFLMCYITPVFAIFGLLVLPDSGLILSLSILIWGCDKTLRSKQITWINTLIFALGFGIGLLSKYHILPLGAGIALGLLIDLGKFRLSNLIKLIIAGLIGIIIASPLFIWNYQNHYASFLFQLQHGFSSDHWQIASCITFIVGAILYLTPWFSYYLFRYGLVHRIKYHLLLPFILLATILIISSLRNNILPHWIAPALWMVIPTTMLNLSNLNRLNRWYKITASLWVILIMLLITPGGAMNIKKISMLFNPDASGLADLLLWQELPKLLDNNLTLNQIQTKLQSIPNFDNNCSQKHMIYASTVWYWVSQTEYYQVFGSQNVLNLDLRASNFFLWRDNLANYANCGVIVIGDGGLTNPQQLAKLMDIITVIPIKSLGDYKNINLIAVGGIFKNQADLDNLQQQLINTTRYY